MLIAKLIGLFADWGLPEPLRKAAAWATVAIAAIAILWGLKVAYDASVVEEHEAEKLEASVEARDEAADQRAKDDFDNAIAEKEATDAIKTVRPADAQLAYDCLRLERIGRVPKPCRRFSGDGSQAAPD